jgi:hypothetical protein
MNKNHTTTPAEESESVFTWFEYLMSNHPHKKFLEFHYLRFEKFENYRIAWAALLAFADEQSESA